MKQLAIGWLTRELRHARRPRPGEYEIDCPMCASRIGDADTTRNLGVNLDKGVFHCWRCGWAGRISDLVKHAGQLERIVGRPQIDLAKVREALTPQPPLEYPERVLPRGYVEVRPGDTDLLGGRVLRYLRKRKLTDVQITRLHPGQTLAPPRYGEVDCRGRVILPITMDGRVVSFVARALGSGGIKTLNPRLGGLPKPLWGLDDLEQRSWVVVVEGIFDALAVQHGVAQLGDRLTRAQAFMLLTKSPRRVVFLGDGDPAGRAGAQRNARKLLDVCPCDVRWAATPEGTDPGDYVDRPRELRRIVDGARKIQLVTWLAEAAGKVR